MCLRIISGFLLCSLLSETTNLSTAVQANGGVGADNTSALSFAGLSPSLTTQTEEWTGSSNTDKTISTD